MSSRDLLGVLFLVYVLLVLPRAAFRTARILRAARTGGAAPGAGLPSRVRILASTIVSLAILLVFSWTVARSIGADLFQAGPLGGRAVLLGLGALAAHLVLRQVARAVRSEEERRSLAARAWMPRTGREWALYAVTCVLAGLAEESAYRGVAMWLLVPRVGLAPAVVVCATAFALAHWVQERKTVAVIWAMALVMHGLVELTATLVVAMAVHVVYDLIAGVLFARREP